MVKKSNRDYPDSDFMEMELLTPREVADYLRVSTKTVYRWIHAGELDAINLGKQPERRGTFRIAKSALREFIKK